MSPIICSIPVWMGKIFEQACDEGESLDDMATRVTGTPMVVVVHGHAEATPEVVA